MNQIRVLVVKVAMENCQNEYVEVKKSDLLDLLVQLSSIKKKLAEFKKQ